MKPYFDFVSERVNEETQNTINYNDKDKLKLRICNFNIHFYYFKLKDVIHILGLADNLIYIRKLAEDNYYALIFFILIILFRI